MKAHYSYETGEEREAAMKSAAVLMKTLHRHWTLKEGPPKPDGRRHLYLISKTGRGGN